MNDHLEELRHRFVSITPHMVDAGMRITALAPSRGSMAMPARPDWLGDPARGLLHPGALTVLADSACGLAVGAALPRRLPYATLDLRMDYLRRAGPGDDIHCEAECFRLTPHVAFARAEVWQSRRDEPVAVAQASFMLSTPGGAAAAGRAAGRPPADAAADGATATDGAGWLPPPDHAPIRAHGPIPYVEYLGVRVSALAGGAPLFRLPFSPRLVGNPDLPALHGGVIAGFAETAATLHLIETTLRGSRFPKGIDFSLDYLRSGRPQETFAACEVVRVGARVALVQVRCWQQSPDRPIAVARAHFLLTAAAEGAAAPHHAG